MAKSGISEERLLDFSGHKSLGMLRRYLDFGLVAPYKQQATLAARFLTTQEEGRVRPNPGEVDLGWIALHGKM